MKRSEALELLDAESIPVTDLHCNLRELEFINAKLGGHRLNIQAFKTCIAQLESSKHLRIVELGSGGGDNLRVLADWCRQKGLQAEFIGVDMKVDCIDYAEKNSVDFPEISFVHSDYRNHIPNKPYDIAFSSLFCHHLNSIQIPEYLNWNAQNSKVFFINDLHRNAIAKALIAILTKLFSKSHLVKHDAPLSVARAWSKMEWKKYFQLCGMEDFSITWAWAFRYKIIGKGRGDV